MTDLETDPTRAPHTALTMYEVMIEDGVFRLERTTDLAKLALLLRRKVFFHKDRRVDLDRGVFFIVKGSCVETRDIANKRENRWPGGGIRRTVERATVTTRIFGALDSFGEEALLGIDNKAKVYTAGPVTGFLLPVEEGGVVHRRDSASVTSSSSVASVATTTAATATTTTKSAATTSKARAKQSMAGAGADRLYFSLFFRGQMLESAKASVGTKWGDEAIGALRRAKRRAKRDAGLRLGAGEG